MPAVANCSKQFIHALIIDILSAVSRRRARSGMACAVLVYLFWTGIANVCTAQAPANDNFTNAIELQGDSILFSGTLTNATYEPGEQTIGCGFADTVGSVWWRWVATSSTAVVVDSIPPTHYPWAELNVLAGTDITALTNVACLRIDSLTNRYVSFYAEAGNTYYLRAIGASEGFTLRLTATNPPIVFLPPKDQNAQVGSSAMFGVVAGGLAPLKYQWQFQGNDLPGETFPTLVLHHLTETNTGAYSVIVSNSSGTTTSRAANLIVSTINTSLRLDPAPSTNAETFEFHLSGVPGRLYFIEQTTNLVDWIHTGFVSDEGPNSTWAVPRTSGMQFVRARFPINGEICIAQLKQIAFAETLWAIENQKDRTQAITELDVAPYMKESPVCPSGGTNFADSYGLTTVWDMPFCKKVPAIHFIDPGYPF